jgi:hypothetical protein
MKSRGKFCLIFNLSPACTVKVMIFATSCAISGKRLFRISVKPEKAPVNMSR